MSVCAAAKVVHGKLHISYILRAYTGRKMYFEVFSCWSFFPNFSSRHYQYVKHDPSEKDKKLNVYHKQLGSLICVAAKDHDIGPHLIIFEGCACIVVRVGLPQAANA